MTIKIAHLSVNIFSSNYSQYCYVCSISQHIAQRPRIGLDKKSLTRLRPKTKGNTVRIGLKPVINEIPKIGAYCLFFKNWFLSEKNWLLNKSAGTISRVLILTDFGLLFYGQWPFMLLR